MNISQDRTSASHSKRADGYAPTAKQGMVHSAARDYLVAANTLAKLTRRFPGKHVREAFREAARFCQSLSRAHELNDSVDALLYGDICDEYARAFNEQLN